MFSSIKKFLAALMFLVHPTIAAAEGFVISVVDQDGDAVSNAVVTLRPVDQTGPDIAPAVGLEISQRNLEFVPDLLIVPVGSDVAFPNGDMTGHHVYSFSPAKTFDIRIIAQGRSASVNFDALGVVAIGCNIHDSMIGFIHVVDTPWTAITDGENTTIIADVPNGRYQLVVWHASQTSVDNLSTREIELDSGRGVLNVDIRVRAPRQRRRRY